MAHFAKLDENNIVLQVIVIDNEKIIDENGKEVEQLGIDFCKKLFGENTNWKQTSYNGNIRHNYAGPGYSYNENLDAFIPPKPFPSWQLDENTCNWISPLGNTPDLTQEEIDSECFYFWDEYLYYRDITKGWLLINPNEVNEVSQ